jgi:hypothetical protein
MLSAMLRWPPFNEHKGWPALACTAIVVVAMLLIALGFVAARILRWRFQFSLRSLLILVLVVAVACGWLASEMARARRQANLVAEASKLGCGILYDYNVSGGACPAQPPKAMRKRAGPLGNVLNW